jgi:lambda family phage portal protein
MDIYGGITRALARIIGLVSPATAVRYLQAHSTLRTYAAAKTTGPNSGWKPTTKSGSGEIKAAWRKVTDKARDLERNNAYVTGTVRRFISNVVGDGLYPKCKVQDNSGELNQELAAEIESRWSAWAEQAGANGDSMTAIQAQCVWHLIVDGEALVHRVSAPGRPLALEVLEGDYLDSSRDNDSLASGGRIVNGIELDRFGMPAAYWLYTAHPSDKSTTSIRVDAKDILHVFRRQRASQTRGISHLASVVGELFDTAEYQDSTLTLARVATAFGCFIQTPNPEDWMPSSTGDKAEDDATLLQYVNPGGIHYLRPGETIQSVKAEQPGAVYADYIKSRLRGASVGAGLSFESFSNDYSNATYGSARQAMLQERQVFRMFSAVLDEKLNVPVYRWFLETQYRLAGLALPGYDTDPRAYWRVQFGRPRMEWIDPAKEAAAAQMRLEMGLETLTELAEAEGRDIDDIMATRAAEIETQKRLGIFGLDLQPEYFGDVNKNQPVQEPQEAANE